MKIAQIANQIMNKLFFILLFSIFPFAFSQQDFFKKFVQIRIDTTINKNDTSAFAMAIIKPKAEIRKYHYRFDYLLLNVAKFHRSKDLKTCFNLYPNTFAMKEYYLQKLKEDTLLNHQINITWSAIKDQNSKNKIHYTEAEMMQIAARFFYVSAVNKDTSINIHTCIAINGVNEINTDFKYSQLAAFCIEAIFYSTKNNNSALHKALMIEKKEIELILNPQLSDLNSYLLSFREHLYKRMENNKTLKKQLQNYYNKNSRNLSFLIVFNNP